MVCRNRALPLLQPPTLQQLLPSWRDPWNFPIQVKVYPSWQAIKPSSSGAVKVVWNKRILSFPLFQWYIFLWHKRKAVSQWPHSLSHWLHSETERDFFPLGAAPAKHKGCTVSKFLFSTDPLLLLSPSCGLTKVPFWTYQFFDRKDKNCIYRDNRYSYKHRLPDIFGCQRKWNSFLSWPASKLENSFQK